MEWDLAGLGQDKSFIDVAMLNMVKENCPS
jgi:hypothetical protein